MCTSSLDKLTDAMRADGARSVLLLAYSTDQFDALAALEAAREAVGAADLTPTMRLIVGARKAVDADSGRSFRLSKVAETYVAATAVASGLVVQPSRAALLPATATNDACAVAATAREGYDAPGPIAQMNYWRRVVAGLETGPAAYGRLAAILSTISLRDAVLVSATSRGTVGLVNATALGEDADGVGRAIAEIVDQVVGQAPGEAADAAGAVLEQVIAHNPADCAPALTIWGVLQWWNGHLHQAAIAFNKALDLNPFYRLAELGLHAVDSGTPPGWVTSGKR